MTNTNIKRALVSSVVALFLCFAMLIGTTYAWFTDSVSSGSNIIQSGTLDVDLVDADNKSMEGQIIEFVAADGRAQDLILWEPGCTYVTEPVYVVNKGSLDLKYEIIISGIVGDAKILEAIEWTVTIGDVVTDLADLKGTLPAGEKSGAIVLTGHMKEDAGNEYQGLSSDGISISVIATQFTSEEDSYNNQYDASATYINKNANGEWEINNLGQFIYFAKTVNEGTNYYEGETVILTSDIDLGGINWTPIGSATAEHGFMGNFDGQNHTIKNLVIKNPALDSDGYAYAGLFAVTEGAAGAENVIKNLTIENVTIETDGHIVAAAIAYPYYTTIENITVCGDIAIKGGDYTSGVLAYTRRCINATNIALVGNDGSYITGAQAVGGVISDIQMNGGLTANYSNFSASNVTITGTKMVGGISGIIGKQTLNGATVEDVTLVCPDTRVGIVSGAYDGKPAINNVTFSNVTGATAIVGAPYGSTSDGSVMIDGVEHITVATTDALNTAIANGITNIRLASGEYTLPSLSGKSGVTIVGAEDGSTKLAGVNSFNFGEDTVIKNVTFKTSGGNSVRYGITSGDVVYENCVFEGKQYGYHVDNANNGTITFNNCTFYGRNALAGSGTYTFNNCTFKYTYSNYNTTNIYSEATFNNCVWDSKLELSIDSGAKAIIDGEEITERVVFIADARALEAFQREVNSKNNTYAGVTVMLSADIDMKDAYYAKWTPIGQTGATQFMGTFDGHGYTIKNLNIDTSKQTGANYSTGLFGWLNNATIKNLTIDTATVTGNHNVGVIAGYMETAGCTISNCHVINATVVANHANDDACGDKVGVIVGHAGNSGVLVEKCTATNSTVTAGRDAGQIAGAALTANVVDCSATGVTVTASGECTGANINEAVIGRVLG